MILVDVAHEHREEKTNSSLHLILSDLTQTLACSGLSMR